MYSTLAYLLDRLDSAIPPASGVIPWSCPVPAFGNPAVSKVATLGLNPSNREFVDAEGAELTGGQRRFHTLASLGLASWAAADASHLRLIVDSCERYFAVNPYDRWFRVLDRIASAAGSSFYDSSRSACHLDLIPYATSVKWIGLGPSRQRALLELCSEAFAAILRESAIEIIVLNGRTVVSSFEAAAGCSLVRSVREEWTLARTGTTPVTGVAFHGSIDRLGDFDLGRRVLVLGYNLNLQSSFGVTSSAIQEIANWVSQSVDSE